MSDNFNMYDQANQQGNPNLLSAYAVDGGKEGY